MSFSQVVTSLKGLFHWVSNVDASVEQAVTYRRVFAHKLTADGAAGDELAEVPVYIDSRCTAQIMSVRFVPADALTAHNTNYKTITVSSRTSAGASATTVASVNTKTSGGGGTGDWTAFSPVTVTLTAANAILPAGGMLTVKYLKSGNGVVIPAGVFVVEYKEIA